MRTGLRETITKRTKENTKVPTTIEWKRIIKKEQGRGSANDYVNKAVNSSSGSKREKLLLETLFGTFVRE